MVWTGLVTFAESFGASAVLYLQGIKDRGGSFSDIDPISVTIGILLALGAVRNGVTLLKTPPPEESVTLPASTTQAQGGDYPDDIIDLGTRK